MKQVIIVLSLLTISLCSFSQEIPISTTTVTGCGGFLLDTGIAFNDYQNNESFTMTLCAEDPETILNLYWNTFNLGTGDQMIIYDGADTSAPLIGTYLGTDLQTTDITSSIDGCLTLVWTSDDSDTGNFSAEITCGPPCVRPFVEVNIPSDLPWRICVDEEITLDASPTVFADGTALGNHTWDFGDGTVDTESWPTVSHSFDVAGAYIVQLFVTDDNDCNSGNTIDVLVEVSTTPSFDGTTENQVICLGAELNLEGIVTPTEWTTVPSSNFGGALFIPDDQSQCFDSEIVVTGFLADQEVTQESDLVNFFINFEHSYMGDLTITFLCPNGQSMLAHSNQGGGTFLGEPIDDDGDPEPGIGYDYYWAPDATNGTWGDESGGGTLPSDTYASESSWDQLIGCPLNGVWSVEICDNLGSDNGFIFDWALTFDPSLYPEDLSFTPSIGLECDSSFWTSNGVAVGNMNECSDVVTTPNSVGETSYVFHAVDNHGCEYTTDVTVEVSEVSTVISDDFSICPGQTLSMGSSVNFSGTSFTNMTYEWTPGDFLSSDGVVSPDVSNLDVVTNYLFTAYPDGFPECSSTSTVTVTPLDGPVAEIEVSEWCPDENASLVAIGASLLDSLNWVQLDPTEYLGNNLSVNVSEEGSYMLSAFACGTFDTQTVFIEPVPCEVTVPNVFSPNNDQWNDTFYINGIEFQKTPHLIVYNRWGGIVFEDTNYKGTWRPGEDDVSDGTYFYVLTLSDGEQKNGTVTILR